MNTPTFFSAYYQYAPGFGYHARQAGFDTHPIITEHILLHEPIYVDPFRKIRTAAKASSQTRACVWWTLLRRDFAIKKALIGEVQNENGLYLLVFQKPKPSHTAPVRLLVTEVTDELPRFAQLSPLIQEQYPMYPTFPLPVPQ